MKNIILSLVVTLISSSFAQAQVSLTEFYEISAAFQKEYKKDMAAQKAVLFINRPPSPQMPTYWWDMDYTHASYSTYTDKDKGIREHNLFIFGGFARIKGMTKDALINTVCHELGHGIGGEPLKKKKEIEPISAEGQSDYFATRYCLERIFKHIKPAQEVKAVSEYVGNLCRTNARSRNEQNFCLRAFQALEVERMIFKEFQGKETSFEVKDPTIVETVNSSETFYPSAQCRIDTMVAGVLKQERPRCWWAPN